MTFRQFSFNNVARNKRVYIGHFLSSTFAVIIFFTFGLIAYHPALGGNITEVSTTMNTLGKGGFQVSQYIIYIFSIFFILYSVSSFLKKRKKEFGILMILGLSPRQFTRLVFYENIIIGSLATVVGIGVGLIFSKLILLISASVLTLEKGLPFYFPAKAITTTGISFMLLFVLISFFTSKTVRVSKLVDLIKSEEKPKPAPRASIWLAVLAIFLIVAGYLVVFYFALALNHMSSAEMVIYMAVVVGLVVIGTYFFFSQLSVYFLKAMKQNDRLFFKRTNILSISELVYRIKDNAITFFLVAVISAVAFTAIGTSAAVGEVLLHQLDLTYAIKYDSTVNNGLERKHVLEIKKELEKEKIPYTLVSTSYQELNQNVMKLSEFNHYAKNLGYKPVLLENKNEVIVIKGSSSVSGPKKGEEVQLKQGLSKVQVRKVISNKYFANYMPCFIIADSFYTEMLKVADDKNNQDLSERHLYGFLVKDWKETHDLAEKISKDIDSKSNHPDYFVNFLTIQWKFMKQINGIFSILTVLVGIVFFVFASSFLYFRLFTDLEKDQEKYRMLSKLGLSKKELNKVVTREMGVLFFLPFIVAVIHSSVAFVAMQQLVGRAIGNISLIQNLVFVLGSFLSFHLVYFFIMRKSYLKQLYRAIF